MNLKMILLAGCLLLLLPLVALPQKKVLNVYAWSGEVPDVVIRQFEKETGVKVNFSTYENNEILYAKLRASKNPGYDVIIPSSYFVDRMRKQNMLEKIDKSKLTYWVNLDPTFLHPAYDPEVEYCVPYVWGITGIFYNNASVQDIQLTRWTQLWDPRFNNQLMLLDDTREVFSMALLALGYSANDSDPAHIEAAFQKLKALMPNVKVFSSDTVVSNIIDEDATIGMAWNGDAYKAARENPNIKFVFPADGFVIWVDNLAIPITAPHKDTAYLFINYMLRADVAKTIALISAYPIANLAARKLLPAAIRNNPIVYPSAEVLKRGQFQKDLGESTLNLYEKYWEQLKMGG